MKVGPTVYFSNRLEELASFLGEALFQKGSDPFEKRIVFVPSHSQKLYLTSFFASHPRYQISAGITFYTLLEGVFALQDKSSAFPSKLALFFAIEQEIERLLEQEEGPDLSEFLQSSSTRVYEQKKAFVAKELAKLFYDYGSLESKKLDTWLEKEGWKQTLWKKIFGQNGCFKSLSHELATAKQLFKIHLFGFSTLPEAFHSFLITKESSVYFLSPSAAFWEDLCSDEERIFLEKKMEGKKVRLEVRKQLSLLLKQMHPLLANWGKVGRNLLKSLGEAKSYLEEAYIEPEGNSLLSYLQESLLKLEPEKKEIALEDTSLLCLSATSKLREVEALFETLQEKFLEDPTLQPKDILVFSGNLESYFPYIQMIFGKEEGGISFSAHGLSSFYVSRKIPAIDSLLALVEARFDRKSVLQFISLPSVKEKWGFEVEDIKRFEKWFSKARILWGFDQTYSEKVLDEATPKDAFKEPFSSLGTWEEGILRLLKGLAMDLDPFLSDLKEEDVQSPWPLPAVEPIEAEKLGEFLKLLFSLQEDLRPLYEKQKRSIKEWTALVRTWLSTYFQKQTMEESFLQELDSLAEELREYALYQIPFSSFQKAIEACFQKKKESFQSIELNTVKFLPMELGAGYPVKVICLLGCDEGAFPRVGSKSPFEEIETKAPSLTQQDRYLFLELILHARKSLIVSFQRLSSKDQKTQGPSLLLQELMSYIDTYFTFKGSSKSVSAKIMREHKAICFDRSYFEKEGFHSHTPSLFLAAKSYYISDKNPLTPFFSSWQEVKSSSLEESPSCIDIKQLEEFAKDPLRFYCKERLGLFFDFEASREEEFFLSPFEKALLKKEAFEKGFAFSLRHAKAKGLLPIGKVGQMGVCDLEAEIKKQEKNLSSLGMNPEDFFSLELKDSIFEVEKEEGRILMPPLVVEVEGKSYSLTGELYPVSSSGFLWTGKSGKIHLPRLLPLALIFSHLAKELQLPGDVFMLETGKKVPFEMKDPLKQLASYLKLFLQALKDPCPVRPDWAVDFLSKSKEEIAKKKEASFKGLFEDPYEEWIFKRTEQISLDLLYEEWHSKWKEALTPLLGGDGDDEL